ncbi:MAG: dihydrofolate reductase [Marinifilaceae bacterium]
MKLALIVAASDNNIIGKDNELIWHLPADLKRFKQLTTGHAILMGRKTFESIGRALPNRRNIVVSRNKSYSAPGCEVFESVEDALAAVIGEERVFVIGGGTIYNALWNRANELFLTRVHTQVDGDTVIPDVTDNEWEQVCEESHQADEKNPYNYTFIDYIRKA